MIEGRPGEPGSASAVRIPTDAPLIGRGRYAIVAKIAEGGMAGVYRGWDHSLKVWRAIKILLPEYAGRDSLRSRFETEAATMARLDHPNVIRVYDVGTDEALPYMVMELAEGGTINGWIDQHGRMPAALACDVTIQVATGLGAAHRIGVVHRDVKPHNVLVTADGVCKVTDFGIARVLFDAGNLTRTGSTMGTIGYMSPEQRADAKVVDARADIYALGALMFKASTGVIVTDLFLVEHEPRLLEHVPEQLREVIVRSCYHDRDRRYADTTELLRTLREVRALLPPVPPGTPRLALPPDDPSLDRSGRAFPEISDILGLRPAASIPVHRSVDSQPAAADPARPSYTMSRPTERRQALRHGEPTPPAARSVDATVHVDSPRAEGTPARQPPAESDAASWVKGLALAALGAWAVFGLAAGWGTWTVRGAAEEALGARARMYATLEQETALLPELEEKGAPSDRVAEMSELYARYVAAQDEPARGRAALAYVRSLREEAARTLAGVPDMDLTAGRATNLERAYASWQNAQREWESTAAWPSGRIAVNLGLAPRP